MRAEPTEARAPRLFAGTDVEVDDEVETRRGLRLVDGEVVTVFIDAHEARAGVVAASAWPNDSDENRAGNRRVVIEFGRG